MKLKDLRDAGNSEVTRTPDPCANLLYHRDPAPRPVGVGLSFPHGHKLLGPVPGHQIIVQNDVTGKTERMVLGPDGHLGAVGE